MTWSPLACGIVSGKYDGGIPPYSRASLKVSPTAGSVTMGWAELGEQGQRCCKVLGGLGGPGDEGLGKMRDSCLHMVPVSPKTSMTPPTPPRDTSG